MANDLFCRGGVEEILRVAVGRIQRRGLQLRVPPATTAGCRVRSVPERYTHCMNMFIPPATKLGGVYWNHPVRLSVDVRAVR